MSTKDVSEWVIESVWIRRDIAEEIKKKYGKPLTKALEEIINQDVCERVLNKCKKCGREVFIWVLKDDYFNKKVYSSTHIAQCKECSPGSNWQVCK